MLELGLKTLVSYLLGSVNGSLLLGKILGGPDIRSVGSGNAGGTNALRARGKWFALGVVVIDVVKGYLAAAWVPGLGWAGLAHDPAVPATWLEFACAAAAIIGHCYPVWFGFAGGKGGATAVGALIAIQPALLVPGLVVWLLVAVSTGYVGLATMLAAIVLPLSVAFTGGAAAAELMAFLVLLAAFIVFTHRANVVRLARGTENRMASLMILRRPH